MAVNSTQKTVTVPNKFRPRALDDDNIGELICDRGCQYAKF